MTVGIYCLYFENADGRYYIGQSINMEVRYLNHCRALKRQDHRNNNLQNAYDKGKVLPTQEILEVVESFNMLDDSEVFWIKEFDSFRSGMNLTPGGGITYGENNSQALYDNETYLCILNELAYTDNLFIEISNALNVSINVVNNISCGRSCVFLQELEPCAYALMISKNGNRVKLYEDNTYVRILQSIASSNKSLEIISLDLQVNLRVVQDIAWGRRHQHLKEEYPELYAQVMDKVGTRSTGPRKLPYPQLVSPDGIVHIVDKAADFAQKYQLNSGKLSMLLNYKRQSHKGWKVYNDRNKPI